MIQQNRNTLIFSDTSHIWSAAVRLKPTALLSYLLMCVWCLCVKEWASSSIFIVAENSSLYIKSSVPLLAHTPLTPKSTQEEMRGREGGERKKQGHQNGCEERDWRSTWGRVHGEHTIRTIYSQHLISKGILK